MLLNKIKAMCEERGLSLRQLEVLAELAPGTIYRWDEVIPAADKLARVARVLDTTSEALLA